MEEALLWAQSNDTWSAWSANYDKINYSSPIVVSSPSEGMSKHCPKSNFDPTEPDNKNVFGNYYYYAGLHTHLHWAWGYSFPESRDPSIYPGGPICYSPFIPPMLSNLKQPRNSCTTQIGNPIIIANGNKFQVEVDYQSQGPFGLSFTRYYNSTAYRINTDIGTKWRHNYARHVSATGTNTLVYRGNGQAFVFNYDGSSWIGDVDIPDTLVETRSPSGERSGWVYTDANDTVESYNATGQLIQITNRAGQSQTLSYDVAEVDGGDNDNTTLDKVTGFNGDVMSFTYDSAHRIDTMTTPQDHVYSYLYDEAGNLSSVTYPDNTPFDDLDNPSLVYHYEDLNYPHHLTGRTDESGSRVSWAFDDEGRAISSELDGGIDKHSLVFHDDGSVTTTNPLGKETTYHFETLHGVKKVVQVQGHATASCAGANKHYTYDDNGYIASKTDWQGNITTYVHNDRGLEISRTEAEGTDEQRTVATQWHTDFRLPINVTQPNKITTYHYDSHGRLLSQSTTAP